jgi:flagellin-like protein
MFNMDKRGVSPVVGTILLIAITVALAAIVATLVSGLGGRGAPPSVMLTVTAQNTDTGKVLLTISHNGGDDLTVSDLKIEAEAENTAMVNATINGSVTTLTVGSSLIATYQWSDNDTPTDNAFNHVIQVFVIHNPSKQKLFSSSSITVQ